MASPQNVTSSLSESVATGSVEDKENIKHLRAQLDSAQQEVKRMRREKKYELKRLEESHQSRLSIALKDLRCKLHKEKQKEWELQKEALAKKHESELHKSMKLKETELSKLRSDLTRCQEELQQCNQRNLSGSARATFESERARQSREVLELRGQKKNLEDSLNAAREETRKVTSEMLQMSDAHQAEMERVKKEWSQEVRKLLEELRSKERDVIHIQREVNMKEQQLTIVKMEKEKMAAGQLPIATKQAVSGKSLRKSSLSSMESSESIDKLSSVDWDSDFSELQDLSPQLRSQVAALECRSTTLAKDNQQLLEQLKTLEGQCETLQEENSQYMEKVEQLESVQQSLEELVAELETANLTYEKEIEIMHESSGTDGENGEVRSAHQMAQEINILREKDEQLTGTIEALQCACAEKDRRIEAISHKLRRHRSKAQHKVVRFLLPPSSKGPALTPGLRETYFGYEEDQSSLDSSEMSGCSHASSRDGTCPGDSSLEDSAFDEPSHEELMQNMQRLVREHLELERAFSLLQAQSARQQAEKQDAVKELEEKKRLISSVQQLTEQVTKHEAAMQKLKGQFLEVQEQNEELEFRNLEMEETNSKLVEEVRNTVTFTGLPELTSDGLLQTYTEENGFNTIHLVALVATLEEINKVVDLKRDYRVALLQAKTVLHVADKSLTELREKVQELQQATAQFEAEKVEWLAASDVANQVALEHEKTRQQLSEAKQTIDTLKARITDFEKAEAVHKYTAEYNDVTEQRYRTEIATLKRRLSSSQEGRDYEYELLQNKLQQIKEAEQRSLELERNQRLLEEELNVARNELCSQQEQAEKLKVNSEEMASVEQLQSEVEGLRRRMSEYEKRDTEITKKKKVPTATLR